MNFKFTKNRVRGYHELLRTIMKSFVFLLCTLSFAFSPNKGFSQDAKITIEKDKKISISKVFKLINEQTDYTFVYRHDLIKDAPKLQLKKGIIKASVLLKQCLSPINFTYEFTANNTILVKKIKKEFIKESNIEVKTIEINITGTVTDESGEPLPGASILEKGTSNGVSTDFDGNYTISVTDENAILVVAFIGYAPKEVPVLGKTEINVVLKEDAAKLDEIVIIGYGSVAKKDLTGSVGVVDNINERPVTSTAAGLQGSVSGVTISSAGGDPTAEPNIQIRGLGTVNNESPLYIVDGVPYFGGPINPFDIASISILKDASSQAIYGVRAAGGVILVTTKKGKNGKLSFDFNTFSSMITAEQPKALSAADRVKYLTQAGFDTTSNPVEYSTVDRTNWVDEIFRTGLVKNYDIGVRGGNDKYTFSSSIGYNKTEGTLINTNADRLTFRLSSSFKVNDKLKIGENIYYTRTTGNSVFTGTTDENGGQSYNGIIAQAIKTNPSVAVYDADGNYNDLLSVSTINPVSTLNRLDIEDVNQDFFANVYFDYKILDNLKLKSSFGINSKTRNFQQFNPKSPEVSKTKTDQNSLDFLTGEQQDWSLETTLSYNETFKDVHNLTLLAGNTLQRFQSTLFSVTGRDFSSELPNLRQLVNATSWTKPLTAFNSNSLIS
jgi:TonB-linked SusC/RagA family outer membrane protein